MKVAAIILSVLVVGLAGGGYYFYDSGHKAQTELETLRNANEELTFKVNDLEKEKAAISNELEEKIANEYLGKI